MGRARSVLFIAVVVAAFAACCLAIDPLGRLASKAEAIEAFKPYESKVSLTRTNCRLKQQYVGVQVGVGTMNCCQRLSKEQRTAGGT